jgi:mannitol-1-phosphate 5-dehydrogenase
MKPIKNRYQIDSHMIVVFGAGKIGRSFIGQLFGNAGYKVVFIDIDPVIVTRLNTCKSYRVIIKGEKDEEIIVRNVEAILASDTRDAEDSIAEASILAVSVGKNALEKAVPVIAAGLERRFRINPNATIDIIIAENMRSAADFMKEQLEINLPPDYPLEKLVGLVETSIGKMVPIMTSAELEKDPLMVYAEPYNTLILDRQGFKSPVPDIKGLAPKDNIKAWVDCKAFIHNLGHATAAYYGNYENPDAVYMYEVLDNENVLRFTKEVMLQSADMLKVVYPAEFTTNELHDHIDDLIFRFRNKALGDTIYRVGHDLPRKLRSDDRFIGAIRLAMLHGMPYGKILTAMSYGFFFRALDEEKRLYQPDVDLRKALSEDFESVLINNLAIDPGAFRFVITELKKLYLALQKDLKT